MNSDGFTDFESKIVFMRSVWAAMDGFPALLDPPGDKIQVRFAGNRVNGRGGVVVSIELSKSDARRFLSPAEFEKSTRIPVAWVEEQYAEALRRIFSEEPVVLISGDAA
jgi:hypothetical protein